MTAPIIGLISGDHRPMRLVRSFQDPVNTFRAYTITDTFYIVPNREKFSHFVFDVGVDPKIKPYIFSIQNRSINTALRCTLTLPPYLRSSLGNVFDIPFVGDTQTHPIQLSAPASGTFGTGTGKGLINVVVSFSEAQANTLIPPGTDDAIIFDFAPRDVLTSPIFIDRTIAPPQDLNGVIITGSVPVDDDVPLEPPRPPVVKIPVYVTQSVEVPIIAPYWRNGVEITVDGTMYSADSLVPGSPPAGWRTEVDGRSYPPIPTNPCDAANPTGTDDTLSSTNQLLLDARSIPPSFGSLTLRRVYVIDVLPFLEGIQTNRIARVEPRLVVADSVRGDTKFKIIKAVGYESGSNVGAIAANFLAAQARASENAASEVVSLVKEGIIPSLTIFSASQPLALNVNATNQLVNEGVKIQVPAELNDERFQSIRIVGLAASILTEINTNGEGEPIQ
jgi:hypothetical protein